MLGGEAIEHDISIVSDIGLLHSLGIRNRGVYGARPANRYANHQPRIIMNRFTTRKHAGDGRQKHWAGRETGRRFYSNDITARLSMSLNNTTRRCRARTLMSSVAISPLRSRWALMMAWTTVAQRPYPAH